VPAIDYCDVFKIVIRGEISVTHPGEGRFEIRREKQAFM
jgi:hypothetical protein